MYILVISLRVSAEILTEITAYIALDDNRTISMSVSNSNLKPVLH